MVYEVASQAKNKENDQNPTYNWLKISYKDIVIDLAAIVKTKKLNVLIFIELEFI